MTERSLMILGSDWHTRLDSSLTVGGMIPTDITLRADAGQVSGLINLSFNCEGEHHEKVFCTVGSGVGVFVVSSVCGVLEYYGYVYGDY